MSSSLLLIDLGSGVSCFHVEVLLFLTVVVRWSSPKCAAWPSPRYLHLCGRNCGLLSCSLCFRQAQAPPILRIIQVLPDHNRRRDHNQPTACQHARQIQCTVFHGRRDMYFVADVMGDVNEQCEMMKVAEDALWKGRERIVDRYILDTTSAITPAS